ncbi:MAG TPA: amidohydrolase family protein, partial [Kofleriaceae bacterium]|nr:amidohydrolase family protein [Kofleriaceae bacterium]
VKLHPFWHRYPVRDLIPIARRCEELKLPVLIHLGDRDSGDWQVLTDACPQLRIIFAHAGMPHFDRMWGRVRQRPNLYVDLSSPYLSERLIRDAVGALGPRRALYGTDAPYGFPAADHSYDYGAIKRWVERLPGRATEIDRMLGGNVEELLAR